MPDFERFNWTDELSIGNPKIDSDHKKLLYIYNELIDLIELNKDREEFAIILSKMTDYTLSHFKTEEKYMLEFSYPNLSKHRSEHIEYIYRVAKLNHDFLSSNPPEPEEVIRLLIKWLTKHIMKSDTDYERYKNEIQSDAGYVEF